MSRLTGESSVGLVSLVHVLFVNCKLLENLIPAPCIVHLCRELNA